MSEQRESFIPFRREDLVRLCLDDGKLDTVEQDDFVQLCEILSAYCHVKGQKTLEKMTSDFTPSDPDSYTIPLKEYSVKECKEKEEHFYSTFEELLQQANYTPVSEKILNDALELESVIPLKTTVDFNDFDRFVIYYQGDTTKEIEIKKWFRKKKISIDVFERVVIVLKFKPDTEFIAEQEDCKFTPNKTYIYLYKDIPRYDLELLFPNVKVRMTLLDSLTVWVPAVAAAVPLLLKVLPGLLIILSLVVIYMFGDEVAESLRLQKNVNRDTFAILLSALSIGVALGGFASKQYTNYQKKRLKFLKDMADTLFFKKLATNERVLFTLIDRAVEEQCKEMILILYHLFTIGKPMTPLELDNYIEQWLHQHSDRDIDFDIEKSLLNLEKITTVVSSDEGGDDKKSLLYKDGERYGIYPLSHAKSVIDHIWDGMFEYNDFT